MPTPGWQRNGFGKRRRQHRCGESASACPLCVRIASVGRDRSNAQGRGPAQDCGPRGRGERSDGGAIEARRDQESAAQRQGIGKAARRGGALAAQAVRWLLTRLGCEDRTGFFNASSRTGRASAAGGWPAHTAVFEKSTQCPPADDLRTVRLTLLNGSGPGSDRVINRSGGGRRHAPCQQCHQLRLPMRACLGENPLEVRTHRSNADAHVCCNALR